MTGDLFHAGHLNLIQDAVKLGELIVCIPTSHSTKAIKGRKPIISLEDRLRIIQAVKGVHLVLGYDGCKEWKKIIRLIKPDIVCRGDDWKDFPGRKTAEGLGIKVILFPYTKRISSISIREKICSMQCSKPKKS